MKKLIQVDDEKCNNCHSCISVCPVKTCIDGSKDKVSIIAERCIGCGRCIPACRQDARSIADDTDQFFSDLAANIPIVAIVAPSAAAVFNENLLKLNSYLKSIGVKAVFDVSFGAELTVKSYLEYAKAKKPKTIIAQPCAALVRYCEIYKPELLEYLPPAHSPMLHTAIMIKQFFPEYKDARIAAISPCTAKTREFEETGLIYYNVTMIRLKEAIEEQKIDFGLFEDLPHDGPGAERAVIFSSPGGLKETVTRDAPEINNKIRRIEGPEIVFKYLNEIPQMVKENTVPFIIDCLNCAAGCNGGPGTGNYNQPIDRLEARVEKRKEEKIEKYKNFSKGNNLNDSIDKYWKPELYKRSYKNSSSLVTYKIPGEKELKSIYEQMNKFSQTDMLNCSACGYFTCQGMAEAIYNRLNLPENCHHYLKTEKDFMTWINHENRKYLDNMDEGMLIVNEDLNMGDLYSEAVKKIFGTSIIKGRSLASLFYPDTESQDSKDLEKFLKLLLKNINSDISMFEDINPLRLAKIVVPSKSSGTGYEEKYISARFKQIKTPEGSTNIIVFVSDQTETIQLQAQIDEKNTRDQGEIEIIARLLETNSADMDEFIEDAESSIYEIYNSANNKDFLKDSEEYNKIFNKLHSLKGLSGLLELTTLSWIIHEAESSLKQHNENIVIAYYMPAEKGNANETGKIFIQKLDTIIAEFKRIKDLREKLLDYVNKNYKEKSVKKDGPIERIEKLLEKTIHKNAEALGKKAELIFFHEINSPEKITILKDIKESLVHMVNNSLDHGIEPPMERMLQGKDETGTISVSLKIEAGNFFVIVADDGKGLDINKIRKKMEKEGIIKDQAQQLDNAILLKNIFKPGYSSKEEVSIISGRGVGLSAVAALLSKHNGKIRIKNNPGKGLSFTMIYPLQLVKTKS